MKCYKIKFLSSLLGVFAICGAITLFSFSKKNEVANVSAMSEETLKNVTCTFTSLTPSYSDYEFIDNLYLNENWNSDYTYNDDTSIYTREVNLKQKYFIYRVSTYVRPLSTPTFRTYKYILVEQHYSSFDTEFTSGQFQGETTFEEYKGFNFRVFSSLDELTFYNVNDNADMPALNMNNNNLRVLYNVTFSFVDSNYISANPSEVLVGDINFVNGLDVTDSSLLSIFNRMCTFKGYNSYTDEFMTASEYQQIIDDLSLRIDTLEVDNNNLSNQVEIAYQQGYANAQHHYEVEMENWGIQQYHNGYGEGYREGFNADSTATTIFTGILSVAMVPINFFLAIFNFEILGINLSAFISAILTILVTIIVVRFVMAKDS